MRRLAIVAAILFVAFAGIQFIRPPLSDPPVTAEIDTTQTVKQILRNSCYDCHSNQTRLRWFDQIVPAYWLVVADVKEARNKLNFSEIGRLPAALQKAALFEAVNQMRFGTMPPGKYSRLHPDSRVTPAQIDTLEQYLTMDSPHPAPANQTSGQLPKPPVTPADVRPAPNGISFVPQYRGWKAISTTDRFDNHTLRAVLANDVALAAVGSNHVNPWPDGTMFAKVAWEQQIGTTGEVGAGKFVQVEFMIKDAKKYATTKGWGWARWKGTDLQPYGKDADFSAECVGCHTPLRDHDFVFTTPIEALSNGASMAGDLPVNPFQGGVITASVNPQDGTMSTLYGNDVAFRNAQGSSPPAFPAGSVLSLVTWSQRPDDHWFGARIPGGIKSVEVVTVTPSSNDYQEFEGTPLRSVTAEASRRDSRVAYILAQSAAVTP